MPSKLNTVTKSKSEMRLVEDDIYDYFTRLGANNLRTYLGNVEKGQPKVFTAPFAKGQTIQQVLRDWMVVLKSIRHDWPTLWDFEMDLAKKVGPLSVQKPLLQRMPDIAHYYDDILLSSAPFDDRCINAVVKEFGKIRGLRLRSQERTVDNMKKSTNSGNPFFTKRRNVVQDTLPIKFILPTDNRFWKFDGYHRQHVVGMQDGESWNYAAVVGWRGQEGGPSFDDVKQRVVWMFPFAVNIEELRVYQPLIELSQRYNLVPAWVSMDAVDEEITALFDSKPHGDLIVCTDFSKFDQHFNEDMQNAAQNILTQLLSRDSDCDRWLYSTFRIKYRIPLVLGYDNALTLAVGNHGMASGSGGTNVDETLAHRALQHEAAMRMGEVLNPHSMCLGDDGILTYPGITVDDVVNAYQRHGQECNKEKQYASTQDCVYLRRWHHEDYRINGVCAGVYSTCRAIGRLRYLERFMDPEYWSPTMVALRQLSIIENCKWHPLFHQFIEFCMKRDKYRLGIDIPGFLDQIAAEAQKAIDHMPDFLGYTKTLQGEDGTGIESWEVVKYLKSKR